ncbi:glycosyltransferase domain-containing protein [Pseudomonadota bacterium]
MLITIQDSKSKAEGKSAALERSLERFGYSILSLDNWDPRLHLISKVVKVGEFLKKQSKRLNPNTIVVLIDAHDVVFTNSQLVGRNSLASMARDFRATGLHYMVSSETRYAHQVPEQKKFFDQLHESPSKYINTGFQMGYLWAFSQVLAYIADNREQYHFPNINDQGLISQFFVEQLTQCVLPDIKVGIDYSRRFVSTLNSKTDFVPEQVNSYFVHVTWLDNEDQNRKFQKVVTFYEKQTMNWRDQLLKPLRKRCFKSAF